VDSKTDITTFGSIPKCRHSICNQGKRGTSDISQVFEMDDILVLSEAITALSGGDLKKKMGILSSASSSVFLT
jgi:hypothetical protein